MKDKKEAKAMEIKNAETAAGLEPPKIKTIV